MEILFYKRRIKEVLIAFVIMFGLNISAFCRDYTNDMEHVLGDAKQTHQQRLSLLKKKLSDVNSALERAGGFQKKSGNIDLPIKVSAVNGKGAFGEMHRQTQVNGKRVVLLINVSDKPVQVQLQSKDGRAIDGYDILNGEAIKGNDINRSFQGVRLMKITL